MKAPDEARAVGVVEGEQVASIGDNRKMLIFPLEQLPEMARGSGVRLQRYKDGGLSDVKTFKGADGLTWTDGAGRAFSLTLKELSDWRGNRADAGRLPPKGFPRSRTSSSSARIDFLPDVRPGARGAPRRHANRFDQHIARLCSSGSVSSFLQLQIIRN